MAEIEDLALFDSQHFIGTNELLDENGKPLIRWTPLGANDSSEFNNCSETFSNEKSDTRLQSMIEEHDVLNTSLLSLTSHFAQVQFRLEQVLHAEPDQKESLLKELEQFAWKGVPDFNLLQLKNSAQENVNEEAEKEPKNNQKKYVKLVIDQLKTQLDDLEKFAYENGEIEHPPTQSVLEKQRIVLGELGERLGFNVGNLDTLSEVEITEQIDFAIMQLTNPNKKNEALVVQLQTQISDLERFIDFLHDDEAPDSSIVKALLAFKKYQQEQLNGVEQSKSDFIPPGYHFGNSRRRQSTKAENPTADDASDNQKGTRNQCEANKSAYETPRQRNQKTVGLITRALGVLQLFASSQQAGKKTEANIRQMEKATKPSMDMKNSSISKTVADAKVKHWGDLRARLEMAIEVVVEKYSYLRSALLQRHRNQQQGNPPGAPPIASQSPTSPSSTCSSSYMKKSSEDVIEPTIENDFAKIVGTPSCFRSDKLDMQCVQAERELNLAIRKHLCPSLALLIEHGIRRQSNTPFGGNSNQKLSESEGVLATWGLGCFSRRSAFDPRRQRNRSNSGPDSDEEDEEEMEEKAGRQRAEGFAWNIFQKFYIMKNGRAFNDTPARKLSDSFSLDIIGGKVVTAKQQLLSSMGTILQLFTKYKRSEESQFRALVCMALNNQKLVPWLRLVLRNPLIVQYLYHPWSYVASTGFDDALQSLNKLSSIKFNLPFDANVRHLQEIQDVF